MCKFDLPKIPLCQPAIDLKFLGLVHSFELSPGNKRPVPALMMRVRVMRLGEGRRKKKAELFSPKPVLEFMLLILSLLCPGHVSSLPGPGPLNTTFPSRSAALLSLLALPPHQSSTCDFTFPETLTLPIYVCIALLSRATS